MRAIELAGSTCASHILSVCQEGAAKMERVARRVDTPAKNLQPYRPITAKLFSFAKSTFTASAVSLCARCVVLLLRQHAYLSQVIS